MTTREPRRHRHGRHLLPRTPGRCAVSGWAVGRVCAVPPRGRGSAGRPSDGCAAQCAALWNAVDAATAACDRLRAVEDESSAALADALNAQDAAMDALPRATAPQEAFATIRVRDIIDERVDAYACHQRREHPGAPDARRWFAASKVGSKTLLLADTLGYVPATPTMQRERAAHPGGYDHADATGCPASRHGDPCRRARSGARRWSPTSRSLEGG